MAAYTRQAGIDFWYDFDDQTLWNRSDQFNDLIMRAYISHGMSLDDPATSFAASYRDADGLSAFRAKITQSGSAFAELFDAQHAIFDKHLDGGALTMAFIDFGQGVLYDDRPPRGRNHFVHMMDGTPDTWVGWHRWHASIRAAMLTGLDEDRGLAILRRVALSWAIQTEADPKIDARDNPGLTEARVHELADYWLSQSVDQLDTAFANNKKRAPRFISGARGAAFMAFAQGEATHYTTVSAILEKATGNGDPDHSGFGRFWTLPLDQFLAIPDIYGNVLIAPPGEQRGANSNLIKILKGLAVTTGKLPRMPRDRPPLSDEDIAYIERWIDEGLNP